MKLFPLVSLKAREMLVFSFFYAILSPGGECALLLPWNILYTRDVLGNRKTAFYFPSDS